MKRAVLIKMKRNLLVNNLAIIILADKHNTSELGPSYAEAAQKVECYLQVVAMYRHLVHGPIGRKRMAGVA